MDGESEERMKLRLPIIFFNCVGGSGWEGDEPTSEFDAIQKTNMAGIITH